VNSSLYRAQSLHLTAEYLIDELKEILPLLLLLLKQSFQMFRQRLNAEQLVILTIILVLPHQTLQSSTRRSVCSNLSERIRLQILRTNDAGIVLGNCGLETLGAEGVSAGEKIGQGVGRQKTLLAKDALEVLNVLHPTNL